MFRHSNYKKKRLEMNQPLYYKDHFKLCIYEFKHR